MCVTTVKIDCCNKTYLTVTSTKTTTCSNVSQLKKDLAFYTCKQEHTGFKKENSYAVHFKAAWNSHLKLALSERFP